MRLKFSLLVLNEVSGNILPISYQHRLARLFDGLLKSDSQAYAVWLQQNGLNANDHHLPPLHVISNLYIPKIIVTGDRLQIGVPRIQFWVSFLPEIGTMEFITQQFIDREIVIGDSMSSVSFRVVEVAEVSPVIYSDRMEYQLLSPIVVKAYRPNHSLEYLAPHNPVFAEFMVEELIERWERYYGVHYNGSRRFRFSLLAKERRKAVSIDENSSHQQKMVGYMMKFRLEMNPELQQFAYDAGLGDDIDCGFGYVELIKKRK